MSVTSVNVEFIDNFKNSVPWPRVHGQPRTKKSITWSVENEIIHCFFSTSVKKLEKKKAARWWKFKFHFRDVFFCSTFLTLVERKQCIISFSTLQVIEFFVRAWQWQRKYFWNSIYWLYACMTHPVGVHFMGSLEHVTVISPLCESRTSVIELPGKVSPKW